MRVCWHFAPFWGRKSGRKCKFFATFEANVRTTRVCWHFVAILESEKQFVEIIWLYKCASSELSQKRRLFWNGPWVEENFVQRWPPTPLLLLSHLIKCTWGPFQNKRRVRADALCKESASAPFVLEWPSRALDKRREQQQWGGRSWRWGTLFIHRAKAGTRRLFWNGPHVRLIRWESSSNGVGGQSSNSRTLTNLQFILLSEPGNNKGNNLIFHFSVFAHNSGTHRPHGLKFFDKWLSHWSSL